MGCYKFFGSHVMGVWGTCQDVLGCDGTAHFGKRSIKQGQKRQKMSTEVRNYIIGADHAA
jgi:hypothetical protein